MRLCQNAISLDAAQFGIVRRVPFQVSDMKIRYVIAVVAAAIPCLVFAQGSHSYQCTMEDMQRRVEILTEPGVTVPCEVHYYKDTEAPGERQVLWSAGAEEGYCESRTEEFVAKLEGLGWSCSQGGLAPAVEPDAEIAPEADEAEEPDAPVPAGETAPDDATD